RSGPILHLPPIGKGQWFGDRSSLTMGRFSGAEGRKVILPALITQLKEDFQISSLESDVPFLKFAVERNKKIGNDEQRGYNFIFEIPPGSPAVTKIHPASAHIKFKTNHPKMPEMKYTVEFV